MQTSLLAAIALAIAAWGAAGCGGRAGAGAPPDGSRPLGAPDGADPACAPPTVIDPDFRTGDGWTTTGSAAIALGDASFSLRSRCELGGIAQTMPSPPFRCAQPLVLHMQTTFGIPEAPSETGGLAIRVNGGWNFLEPPTGTATLSICLGARLYGGTTDLFIGGGTLPIECALSSDLDREVLAIDHVTIGPDDAGTCPAIGTVTNGDFEAGPTAWTLAQGDGTAEIAAGIGADGSWGARLAMTHLCAKPRVRGALSVPLRATLPAPALRLWSNGTPGAVVELSIGPGPAHRAYLRGTGQPTRQNVCMPAWAEGTAQSLTFRLVETDGQCGTAAVRDFAIDDLGFVSDPSCAADANPRDPGFEEIARPPSTVTAWVLQADPQRSGGTVELRIDPAAAHTGQAAAVLSAPGPCAAAVLAGDITVPAAAGAAGPALDFWYRSEDVTQSELDVELPSLVAPLSLPGATEWTHVRACLDARQSSRPDRLAFVARGGGGLCDDTFAVPERFIVDDVELEADPACAN